MIAAISPVAVIVAISTGSRPFPIPLITSDNVYYVRFRVGFCLGNRWFLRFVGFAADVRNSNAALVFARYSLAAELGCPVESLQALRSPLPCRVPFLAAQAGRLICRL